MNNKNFRFPHPIKFLIHHKFLTILAILSLFFILGIVGLGDNGYAFASSESESFDYKLLSRHYSLSQFETVAPTATSTPTATATQQFTPTQTATLMPSSTATSTAEVDPTATPTVIILPTGTATSTEITPQGSTVYAPVIANHFLIEPVEIQIDDYLICDSLSSPLDIPDADPPGIENRISVNDEDRIVDLEIYLNVDHTWIGDLSIRLSLNEKNINTVLVDRPGIPGSNLGCGLDNLRTILDDQASQPAESKCLSYPAAIAGIYQPFNTLSVFKGLQASGTWTLNLSDNASEDIGRLNSWCLHFSLSPQMPPPTPPPTPVALPESARIYGISGQDQALPLDCESRSAVDWANYFGTQIGEFEFLNQLPISDDPDLGFVGDVNGVWGQIPPNDYGVHAGPVADLLVDFGLNANAQKSLTWDDIRKEISESRPVIVWVIGSVINGAPNYYTSQSSNKSTIVARYEHTVMVIGYTPDSVVILDGDSIYTRSLDRFLESWSALNNMAVLTASSDH